MKNYTLIILFALVGLTSCKQASNPKPKEYFRITVPKKAYQFLNDESPYLFKYPVYANIQVDKDLNTEEYWKNIYFPEFKATIYISYKTINNNLDSLTDDSRTLAYKHVIKADAIDEILIENDSAKVYGIFYKIKGNAASPAQFHLTDSATHYLRGSLYFYVNPNKDSLAPVIDFLVDDIDTLINSFRWK